MGAHKLSDDIMAHGTARDCKEPMGWTSENVSNDFGVSREEMDNWAAMYNMQGSAYLKTELRHGAIGRSSAHHTHNCPDTSTRK